MPVCGNYLFFELPKKIVLNPKDGSVIINFEQVQAMRDQTIYFENGKSFALGRTNYISTKQAFAAYLKKLPM